MSLIHPLAPLDFSREADPEPGGDTSAPRRADSARRPKPPVAAQRGTRVQSLPMRHGGRQTVAIRWECQGPAAAPVVIVQGGISAHRHLAATATFAEPGWWQDQVGLGAALDSARFRLLAIDWLGADGELDVCIDPADQAAAMAAVLHALGIERAAAFVGASYGAMVGLQFAALYPARLGRLIALSGAHRSSAQATAWRVIQRRIVKLVAASAPAAPALALARALAVIGYRSAEEFQQRFAAAPVIDHDTARFPVEDYFDAVGSKAAAQFSATAYLRLSESIDLQRLDPATIGVATDLVGVCQDQIVPLADLEELAAGIAAPTRLYRIHSVYGHDAFLKEVDQIGVILRQSLSQGVAS
ncbi:MAG: homoserine acetyltransferase [Lysobacterales bacterium CG02_land_8_20_14_3_00_62_12]|nr:MAG: homoserine acetyltransferase [Xanthomonadales bacterium CG02_land_8_20_14_3_00_62_12]